MSNLQVGPYGGWCSSMRRRSQTPPVCMDASVPARPLRLLSGISLTHGCCQERRRRVTVARRRRTHAMDRSMSWLNLGSLAGLVVLAFLAWAAGGFRRPVPWRTVLTAGGLMLVLGAVVFWVPWTRTALIWIKRRGHRRPQSGERRRPFPFRSLGAQPGRDHSGRVAVGGLRAGHAGVACGGVLRVADGGALPPADPAARREALRRPLPQDHGSLGRRVPGRFVQHLHRRGIGHDRAAVHRPHDALRAC